MVALSPGGEKATIPHLIEHIQGFHMTLNARVFISKIDLLRVHYTSKGGVILEYHCSFWDRQHSLMNGELMIPRIIVKVRLHLFSVQN